MLQLCDKRFWNAWRILNTLLEVCVISASLEREKKKKWSELESCCVNVVHMVIRLETRVHLIKSNLNLNNLDNLLCLSLIDTTNTLQIQRFE